MHNPRLHDPKLRRILRPFMLAAALGLTPAVAAQANEASQSSSQSGMNQSGGQSQTMNQAGETGQPGDEIALTQQEASEWRMRPVVDESGEKVGQVSAITLDDQGNISQLEVEMEQTLGLGGKTVTLEPGQFLANKEQVILDMSTEEIRDLPKAQ